MLWVLAVAAAVVVGISSLRWLRIAQREHYLAGSVSRFAYRWWTIHSINGVAFVVALAAVGTAAARLLMPAGSLVVLLVAAFGPFGLSLKGTSSKLAWTDRLRRLAVAAGALWLVVAGVALVLSSPALLLGSLLGLPVLFDVALAMVAPIERRLGKSWVDQAARHLANVAPSVVAITGSYGKTTTKEYAKRILSASRPTVASPASFNNRMGLARAINEHLSQGTEVFVAEMGTYGPGEIADLCRWIRPTVGVITAIGPVHLERFGSLENTLAAKSEILADAEVAVLNIDDERLANLAGQLADQRVVTCSATGADADVSLVPTEQGFRVMVAGELVTEIPELPLASNLACAIGVAVALGAPLERLDQSLAGAETPQHRQSVYLSETGFSIIDDTYNSNPAGVRAALETLAGLAGGKRVVVSPGMVELGSTQSEENRQFGALAGQVATHFVIVGRTNRRALLEGAQHGPASVIVMPSREKAVDWVKAHLGPGDAVLYENDLPDHYA